jgi:hypothetical protein
MKSARNDWRSCGDSSGGERTEGLANTRPRPWAHLPRWRRQRPSCGRRRRDTNSERATRGTGPRRPGWSTGPARQSGPQRLENIDLRRRVEGGHDVRAWSRRIGRELSLRRCRQEHRQRATGHCLEQVAGRSDGQARAAWSAWARRSHGRHWAAGPCRAQGRYRIARERRACWACRASRTEGRHRPAWTARRDRPCWSSGRSWSYWSNGAHWPRRRDRPGRTTGASGRNDMPGRVQGRRVSAQRPRRPGAHLRLHEDRS